MKTEQIPGADLSLNIVPNNIPKNMFVISIGNWLANKRKTLPKDINPALENKENINPVTIQINVCNNPINNPTRKYPKIKWYDFIGEEYNLFKKKVCLSFETTIANVNITKEYENTIIPGSKDKTSKVAVLPFENLFII